MNGFNKVVSHWAHKEESPALVRGNQHLLLRAKEELSEEQAQTRASVGIQVPVREPAWPLKEALRTEDATVTVATAAAWLDL